MRVSVVPRDLFRRPNAVDMVALDRSIERHSAAVRSDPALTIDLTRADYIDHDALLMLGGIVAARKRVGQGTLIELPDRPRIVDFLRAWDFPKFIRTVADPLPVFTDASELILSTSGRHPPRYISYRTDPGGEREPLLLRTNLAITQATLTADAWSDAESASERFRSLNFLSVLRRTIGTRAPAWIPKVIHEAIHNAATHPNANLAFTSCQFKQPSLHDDNAGQEMQIAVWDDGDSFSSTLLATLEMGEPIINSDYGTEGVTFDVAIRPDRRSREVLTLTDSEPPVSEDPGLLSCAAFMLGVSSDPNLARHPRRGSSDRGTRGGTGLYTLRRVAIDEFDGIVSYRTEGLLISLRRGQQPSHYSVTVSDVLDSGWLTRGNLLLIDLPCQAA